jgi:hypothetical protein
MVLIGASRAPCMCPVFRLIVTVLPVRRSVTVCHMSYVSYI